MAQIEVVDRASIPEVQRRGAGKPATPNVLAILEAVTNLTDGAVLKLTCKNKRATNYLVTRLSYQRNKEKQANQSTLSQLQVCQGGNTVFCWLESPTSVV